MMKAAALFSIKHLLMFKGKLQLYSGSESLIKLSCRLPSLIIHYSWKPHVKGLRVLCLSRLSACFLMSI